MEEDVKLEGNLTENQTEKKGTYADIYKEEQEGAPRKEDFRDRLGMEILERRSGYAKGELKIQPWHLNVLGVIHGGVLFSLADTVSGTAAAEGGYRVTTVNGSINYLRAGKDTPKITAEAEEVKKGKTFSVCDAKIYDDKGTLLATTTMTFYHLSPR